MELNEHKQEVNRRNSFLIIPRVNNLPESIKTAIIMNILFTDLYKFRVY